MCVGSRQSASLKGFNVLHTGRLRYQFIALVYVLTDLLVKLLLYQSINHHVYSLQASDAYKICRRKICKLETTKRPVGHQSQLPPPDK